MAIPQLANFTTPDYYKRLTQTAQAAAAAQNPQPSSALNIPPGSNIAQIAKLISAMPGGTVTGPIPGLTDDPAAVAAYNKGVLSPTPGAPAPQFDPSAGFNQQTPSVLPQLNTSGANPYLNDPLMSSFYRLNNPLYSNQQQQDFYGDSEIFNAPTAGG